MNYNISSIIEIWLLFYNFNLVVMKSGSCPKQYCDLILLYVFGFYTNLDFQIIFNFQLAGKFLLFLILCSAPPINNC